MTDSSDQMRRDLAVIMARGRSARMGYPKGTAVLGPGQPPLLAVVDRLYRELDWPRMIVTLEDLMVPYQALLDPDPESVWVAAAPGGDTALTLKTAWDALSGLSLQPTHLWAHPVDLPLVKRHTVAIIREQSRLHPDKIVRPVHEGQPGHPVVLPTCLLPEIFDPSVRTNIAGPMRNLLADLAAGGRVTALPVTDPGVVRDFDHPEDLQTP